MAAPQRSSEQSLLAGRIWPLRRARGHRIVCHRGELWITVDGELEDRFVKAGEALEITTDARLAVYAVEDSAFRVVAPAPAAGRRYRWWHALRDALA
jgi:quercetin dioxygenase-like cupin family protein